MTEDTPLFPSTSQPIVGYHLDEDGDWVAELACGHNQHVRHNPPWKNRPWTTTEAGRASMIGQQLGCRKCVAGSERDWVYATTTALGNCLTIDSLCHEG